MGQPVGIDECASDLRPAPSTATTATTATTAGKVAPPPPVEMPDAAERIELIAQLGDISPVLIADADLAVGRARNICLDIRQGNDEATLARNAELRF